LGDKKNAQLLACEDNQPHCS